MHSFNSLLSHVNSFISMTMKTSRGVTSTLMSYSRLVRTDPAKVWSVPTTVVAGPAMYRVLAALPWLWDGIISNAEYLKHLLTVVLPPIQDVIIIRIRETAFASIVSCLCNIRAWLLNCLYLVKSNCIVTRRGKKLNLTITVCFDISRHK